MEDVTFHTLYNVLYPTELYHYVISKLFLGKLYQLVRSRC